ncbi:MAG TPA: tRNA (guanosine(46)-N7)-methyltransferase TrmB [Thermoanaerobaculia bacterium]|nr:tRNA (guanosine(46)-N7)-methyltransferase TrmB [Thermoanaerobaculia bacterium]
MARPSTRRALKRAGLAPEPRAPRGPRRNRGVPPPPLVRLPGEPEEPPPVDFAALFGRTAPVEMEIGVGKARFLLTEAAAHKERDFFGIELQSEYARIAQAKADKLGLTNVRVARLDGKAFVASRLAPASLDVLHVFFPDPWPKKRHHKRRLVDASFARAAATALKPGAILRVASDHAEYWAAMVEALDGEPLLSRVPEPETGPWTSGTDYELKFTKGGKPIGRGIWRRAR